MFKLLFSCVLLSVISSALSASCNNPEVSAVSFTTQDATVVTNIAFVAEFSLKCSNSGATANLYADINGNVVPVAIIGDQKYQVGYKHMSQGGYQIKLQCLWMNLMFGFRSVGLKKLRLPEVVTEMLNYTMKKVTRNTARP